MFYFVFRSSVSLYSSFFFSGPGVRDSGSQPQKRAEVVSGYAGFAEPTPVYYQTPPQHVQPRPRVYLVIKSVAQTYCEVIIKNEK